MGTRIALRVAYYGPDFEGFARQPGMHTVEGEVINALCCIRAWKDGDYFMSSSRTDRGVSARGNVIAFDTDFDKDALPKALDSALDSVILRSVAVMPAGTNPRHARSRTYSYGFPPVGGCNLESGKTAASLFVGEHDFGAFCRRDERTTTREVLRCDLVEREASPPSLVVVGRSFLWQQVRRMAGAVSSAMAGETDPSEIARALESGEGTFPPLPPGGLVLEDVDMPGLEWKDCLGERGLAVLLRERARWTFFDSLLDRHY